MGDLLLLTFSTRLERERLESPLTRQVYWILRGKEIVQPSMAALYLPVGYRACPVWNSRSSGS